jgi:hypothetical protein
MMRFPCREAASIIVGWCNENMDELTFASFCLAQLCRVQSLW